MTLVQLVDHHDWSEKYRPQSVKNVVLSKSVESYVSKCLAEKKVHNAVFVGTPGLGKTTIAKALGEDLGLDVLVINSSKDGTMDELRTTMQHFVQTASLDGSDKLLVLDEGDNLHPKMMAALRGFIQEYSIGCSFIITLNNVSKLEDAILSRCPVVDFSIDPEDVGSMMSRYFATVKSILDNECISFTQKDLATIIRPLFPDLRRTINLVQRACKDGTFDPSQVPVYTDSHLAGLYEVIKSGTYVAVLEWVDANPHVIANRDVYRMIYEMYRKRTDADTTAQAVLVIEEYMDKATRSINPTITVLGCLASLLRDASIS